MRKPLTQAETDELNGRLRLIAERMERRNQRWNVGSDEYQEALTAILSQLRDEPRDE
jgi:hypothetical protein